MSSSRQPAGTSLPAGQVTLAWTAVAGPSAAVPAAAAVVGAVMPVGEAAGSPASAAPAAQASPARAPPQRTERAGGGRGTAAALPACRWAGRAKWLGGAGKAAKPAKGCLLPAAYFNSKTKHSKTSGMDPPGAVLALAADTFMALVAVRERVCLCLQANKAAAASECCNRLSAAEECRVASPAASSQSAPLSQGQAPAVQACKAKIRRVGHPGAALPPTSSPGSAPAGCGPAAMRASSSCSHPSSLRAGAAVEGRHGCWDS